MLIIIFFYICRIDITICELYSFFILKDLLVETNEKIKGNSVNVYFRRKIKKKNPVHHLNNLNSGKMDFFLKFQINRVWSYIHNMLLLSWHDCSHFWPAHCIEVYNWHLTLCGKVKLSLLYHWCFNSLIKERIV